MSLEVFLLNPWVIAIGGGVIVLAIGWLGRRLFMRSTKSIEDLGSKSENRNQSTVINANFYPSSTPSDLLAESHTKVSTGVIPTLKSKAKILFIEDETFKQISNLRNSGWNVSQVKDVADLDMPEIRDSHIIFVDYKNVGKRLSEEEGLGIVKALKARYGKSKWIVFYSAHQAPFSVFSQSADSYLVKNSSFIEIEQKIIEGAKAVLQ